MKTTLRNAKGLADFIVIEDGRGVTVALPDLVASHLRIIRLGR